MPARKPSGSPPRKSPEYVTTVTVSRGCAQVEVADVPIADALTVATDLIDRFVRAQVTHPELLPELGSVCSDAQTVVVDDFNFEHGRRRAGF